MAPKRKAAAASEPSASDGPAAAEAAEPSPAAKPKRARAKKELPTEPFESELGFTVHPPSLIYKDFGTKPNTKIAAIDLDGTLVNTKSAAPFPRSSDDWKWYNKKALKIVQQWHAEDYKIVIFTNQGGIKSALDGAMSKKVQGRIKSVVEALAVPVQVFIATLEDKNRKPDTGMWQFFLEHGNGSVEPDMEESFFVGDAAGRPADFSDSDKLFAANVGIPFKLPEDVFGDMEGKRAMPSMTAAAKAAATAEGAGAGGGGDSVNAPIVEVFNKLVDHYAGEPFKAGAFKKVAATLSQYPVKVELSNLKDVGKLPGIGKGSLAKIKEYLETGKIQVLEEGGAGEKGEGAQGAKPSALQLLQLQPSCRSGRAAQQVGTLIACRMASRVVCAVKHRLAVNVEWGREQQGLACQHGSNLMRINLQNNAGVGGGSGVR